MMIKGKYQMTSNQRKKRADMNCSMTTTKKRKRKEDLKEQGIKLKPWIPRGVENVMQKTVHRRNLCSFMKTKIG